MAESVVMSMPVASTIKTPSGMEGTAGGVAVMNYASSTSSVPASSHIVYRPYVGESDLPNIMALVQSELSEPYVIYTYRYFLQQWPHLSFLACSSSSSEPVGVIVCKQSLHRNASNRGYIAMLSVHKNWRKRGIARTLVKQSIDAMKHNGAEEISLETEYDNTPALSLYESLGFIREKRLYRFYMNGKDAFRLILSIPPLPSLPSSHGSPTSILAGSSLELPLSPSSPPGPSRDLRSELERSNRTISSSGASTPNHDMRGRIRDSYQTPLYNPYNLRVLPEYIAGFDDSESDDDADFYVSRR